MGMKSKIVGALIIFVSIVCFLINFGIWFHWPLTLFPGWFWNPLSLLTSGIVGNVPIISGSIGFILNYIFALVYSAVMFVIGAFAFLKS
jgi:hypothetical protein